MGKAIMTELKNRLAQCDICHQFAPLSEMLEDSDGLIRCKNEEDCLASHEHNSYFDAKGV